MFELLAAWATSISLVLFVGDKVDERLNPSYDRTLVNLLQTTIPPYPFDWFKRVNEAFQIVFDLLYGSQDRAIERLIWLGIFTAYPIFAIVRTLFWLSGLEPLETPLLLTAALGFSLAVVFGMSIFGSEVLLNALEKVNKIFQFQDYPKIARCARWFIASLLMGVFFAMPPLLDNIVRFTIPIMVGWVLLEFVVLSISYIGTLPKSMYPIRASDGWLYAILSIILCILALAIGVVLDILLGLYSDARRRRSSAS